MTDLHSHDLLIATLVAVPHYDVYKLKIKI
jgi:hypothetical protein